LAKKRQKVLICPSLPRVLPVSTAGWQRYCDGCRRLSALLLPSGLGPTRLPDHMLISLLLLSVVTGPGTCGSSDAPEAWHLQVCLACRVAVGRVLASASGLLVCCHSAATCGRC
jgi:hypothetical protein